MCIYMCVCTCVYVCIYGISTARRQRMIDTNVQPASFFSHSLGPKPVVPSTFRVGLCTSMNLIYTTPPRHAQVPVA